MKLNQCFRDRYDPRALLAIVAATVIFSAGLAWTLASCLAGGVDYDVGQRDFRFTFLHTADIHSRLVPYHMVPSTTDEKLGLLPEDTPYGGAARLATIIKEERRRADRVMHLDSGDVFQGAPIFNVFSGEVEMQFLNRLGVEVVAVGNHEFDRGVVNLAKQVDRWVNFPLLVANYAFDISDTKKSDLGRMVQPYTIINVKGVKIGVIGLGDIGSLSSIIEGGNSLGITPINAVQVVRDWIAVLRPQVQLIVVLSHLGLTEDRELIAQTPDIDVVFGGHLHVALAPPEVLTDPWGRDVLLVHSGAFAKYVGRLDIMANLSCKDPGSGAPQVFEDHAACQRIKSFQYKLIPVSTRRDEKGEPLDYSDPAMLEFLEPYLLKMNQELDLTQVFAYAPRNVYRFGRKSEDSELGNLVADAIRLRQRVEAEFSLTNTLGIRTDIQEGPVTLEQMFNVFPFDNSISIMYLSGSEVQELFDYVTSRSAGRGCATQAQISGASFVMNCGADPPVAEDARVGGAPLDPNATYKLATNDYIAKGGSGFKVLKRNTTRIDTGISLRDATIDFMRHQVSKCHRVDFVSYDCLSEKSEEPHQCWQAAAERPDGPSWADLCPEADGCFNKDAYEQHHRLSCVRYEEDGRIQRRFR